MNENEIISLTDENGEEKNYAIIESVEYEGKVYVALVEENELGRDECEFIVLRVDTDEENPDEDILSTITDEDEFNEVMQAIEAKLDEEYDFEDYGDNFDEDAEI